MVHREVQEVRSRCGAGAEEVQRRCKAWAEARGRGAGQGRAGGAHLGRAALDLRADHLLGGVRETLAPLPRQLALLLGAVVGRHDLQRRASGRRHGRGPLRRARVRGEVAR